MYNYHNMYNFSIILAFSSVFQYGIITIWVSDQSNSWILFSQIDLKEYKKNIPDQLNLDFISQIPKLNEQISDMLLEWVQTTWWTNKFKTKWQKKIIRIWQHKLSNWLNLKKIRSVLSTKRIKLNWIDHHSTQTQTQIYFRQHKHKFISI